MLQPRSPASDDMRTVREVERHRRQLNAAFTRVTGLADLPNREEIEADYARYLCVMVSGFAERAIAELILQYSTGKAPKPLLSYVANTLQRQTNLDKERLCRLIGSLDAGWGKRLEGFVTDRRQAALNSVVGLRHNIAHGGAGTVTLGQMRSYWMAVQEIVDEVEAILAPPPRQRR